MKSYIAYVAERGKEYPFIRANVQAYTIEQAEMEVLFNVYQSPEHKGLDLIILYITELPEPSKGWF